MVEALSDCLSGDGIFREHKLQGEIRAIQSAGRVQSWRQPECHGSGIHRLGYTVGYLEQRLDTRARIPPNALQPLFDVIAILAGERNDIGHRTQSHKIQDGEQAGRETVLCRTLQPNMETVEEFQGHPYAAKI